MADQTQYEDFDAQEALLQERRRALAQQLLGLQQQQLPAGQMVGNRYIPTHPLQYVAQAIRQYGAQRGGDMAMEDIADLQKRKSAATSEALRNFGDMTKQSPEDLRGAYIQLLNAPVSSLRDAAMRGIISLPEMEAKKEERQATRDFQQSMAQERMDFQREMLAARQAAGGGGNPYYQPVQTAQGVFAFNARTGKIEPVAGPNGAPIIGAAADPALQGNIAGSKESGKLGAQSRAKARKDAVTADNMLGMIGQAESLLKQHPTDSGAGAIRDQVGNFFGYSAPSSIPAASLETLAGWMTSNVPRMEGPQSNYDVENYKTMAGMVGNRSVPVAQRLQAVGELKRLQEKYRHLNMGMMEGETPLSSQSTSPSQPQGNGGYDPEKEARYQAWLKAQGGQ